MSYLLTQMFLYMLVAFLLGLLLGWVLWRYGADATGDADTLRAERDALAKERDDLNTNLESCRTRSAQDRENVERLRADKIDLQNRLDAMAVAKEAKAVAPAPAPVPVKAAPVAAPAQAFVGDASKPEGLSGPRAGGADDLQQISGVGPKLEKLLHSLGYFHFDQIGAWTRSEEAWVDENLEGFKGRVSRDSWIAQAKKLAKG